MRPGRRVTRQAGNSWLEELGVLWESGPTSSKCGPVLHDQDPTEPACVPADLLSQHSAPPRFGQNQGWKKRHQSGWTPIPSEAVPAQPQSRILSGLHRFAPLPALPALRLISLSLSLSAASARPLFQAPQHGAPSRTPGRPSPTYIQITHITYLPSQPPYGPGPTLRCLPAVRLHPPTPAAASDDILSRNNRNTPDDPSPVPGPPHPRSPLIPMPSSTTTQQRRQ